MLKTYLLLFWVLFSSFSASSQSHGGFEEKQTFSQNHILYKIEVKDFIPHTPSDPPALKQIVNKINHLSELGITCVLLDLNNCNLNNYACFRHDSILPEIGNWHDFEELSRSLNEAKIQFFLKLNENGFNSPNSLTKQHSDWFFEDKNTYQNFNWKKQGIKIGNWWENVLNTFVKYGVSGFIIQQNSVLDSIWNRSAKNKQIIFIEENGLINSSSAEAIQMNKRFQDSLSIFHQDPFFQNPADFYNSINQNDILFLRFKTRQNTFDLDISINDLYYIGNKNNKTISKSNSIQKNIKFDKRFDSIQNVEYSFSPKGLDKDFSQSIPEFSPLLEQRFFWKKQSKNQCLLNFPIQKPSKNLYLFLENNKNLSLNSKIRLSRSFIGFSLLFFPIVPILEAGSEFADPNANGRIDFDQLKSRQNLLFFRDVQKMIAIRKQEADIFQIQNGQNKVIPLKHQCELSIPVPYLIYNQHKAIFVACNPNEKNIKCIVDLPLKKIFPKRVNKFKITDPWNNSVSRIVESEDIEHYVFEIWRDWVSEGGLFVLKIEPVK